MDNQATAAGISDQGQRSASVPVQRSDGCARAMDRLMSRSRLMLDPAAEVLV